MFRNLATWICLAVPQILFSLAPQLASAQASQRTGTETTVRVTSASLERFAQFHQTHGGGHSSEVVERRMNDPSLRPYFESLARGYSTASMTVRTCGSETIGFRVRTGPLSFATEIAVNLSSRLPVYAFRETRSSQQIVLDYNTLTVHVHEGANSFGRERRYKMSFEQWIRRAASPRSDSVFRRLSSLGFLTMSAIHNNLPLIAANDCPPFLRTYLERALDEADRSQDDDSVGTAI